jgi:hypothetical protein
VYLGLGKVVIWIIKDTLGAMMKMYKYIQKSKPQDGTKPNTKMTKKRIERGLSRALDRTPKGIGPKATEP